MLLSLYTTHTHGRLYAFRSLYLALSLSAHLFRSGCVFWVVGRFTWGQVTYANAKETLGNFSSCASKRYIYYVRRAMNTSDLSFLTFSFGPGYSCPPILCCGSRLFVHLYMRVCVLFAYVCVCVCFLSLLFSRPTSLP